MNLSLRVPPAVIVLIIAALQWLAALVLPRWPGDFAWRTEVALVLLVCGIAIATFGVVTFRRARTSVNPMNPSLASSLVSNGIYRLSRNSMYLGFAIWLLAWSVLLGSLFSLFGVVVFVMWMNRFQIAPEEHALQRLFGETFERYRNEVRRWI